MDWQRWRGWLKMYGASAGVVIGVCIFLLWSVQQRQRAMDATAPSTVDVQSDSFVAEGSSIAEPTWYIDIKGEVLHPGVYAVTPDMRINDVIALAGGLTTDADDKQVNFAQKVSDQMVIIVPRVGETVQQAPASPDATAEKVHLNSATKEELMALDGVGEKKAALIIAYREAHGPFRTLEDLTKVQGISDKTIEKWRDKIVVP